MKRPRRRTQPAKQARPAAAYCTSVRYVTAAPGVCPGAQGQQGSLATSPVRQLRHLLNPCSSRHPLLGKAGAELARSSAQHPLLAISSHYNPMHLPAWYLELPSLPPAREARAGVGVAAAQQQSHRHKFSCLPNAASAPQEDTGPFSPAGHWSEADKGGVIQAPPLPQGPWSFGSECRRPK